MESDFLHMGHVAAKQAPITISPPLYLTVATVCGNIANILKELAWLACSPDVIQNIYKYSYNSVLQEQVGEKQKVIQEAVQTLSQHI